MVMKQPIQIMTPIDPVIPASADPRSPMAPPYVDEDPNLALVEEGLAEADNETREAMADSYETSALESDEPEEELDDIDFSMSEDASSTPEIAAIHEDLSSLDEDEEQGEEE